MKEAEVQKLRLLVLYVLVLPGTITGMDITTQETAARIAQELLKNPLALHRAAGQGNLEKVQQLLDASAKVNATDWVSTTPLHVAIGCGKLEVVQLLINRGADVHATCVYCGTGSTTPLHIAAACDQAGIIQCLIKNGANEFNYIDDDFHTPLDFAIDGGYTKTIEVLLKYTSKIYHGASLITLAEHLAGENFFLPCWRVDKESNTVSPLKNKCLVFLLKDLKKYEVLKTHMQSLGNWGADLIADQVPLEQQKDLIKLWQQDNSQESTGCIQLLFAAHYRRHLVWVQRILTIKNKDLQNNNQTADTIFKAHQLSDLDEKFQQLIINNIKSRLT